MNERLRAVAVHFRARLADAATDDLCARYDFGCVLHMARYEQESRIGERSVEELGKLLGVHTSALHRQARVIEVIRPDEFATLLTERYQDGRPLSWSHFERLATVRARNARMDLARLATTRGLGVRELGEQASSRR